MRLFLLILLNISISFAQESFKTIQVSDEEQIKLFNRVEVLAEKNFDTLMVRVLGIKNDSGSAGFENCEVNTNIFIAVSRYDEFPDQSLFKLSALYSPKIIKIIEEDSKPSIYLSFIDNSIFKCIKVIVLLNNISYSFLDKNELLIVHNPSVIFFHPTDKEISDKNLPDDSGMTEVISDFNYYSNQIESYITGKKIKPIFSAAKVITLWQKGHQPQSYFRNDFNQSFGYILTSQEKKPKIFEGVFTDIDLKQGFDEYFNIKD